jgi:nucleoid-associated protein YgaU
MRKDVKIGMVIGSLLAVAAIVWISMHSNLADSELLTDLETRDTKKPAASEKFQPLPSTDKPGNLPAETESQEIFKSKKVIFETAKPASIQQEEPDKTEYERIHTVLEGETLSGISQKYYGTASGWQKIYVANRKLLSSPDRIRPGMRLIIPE